MSSRESWGTSGRLEGKGGRFRVRWSSLQLCEGCVEEKGQELLVFTEVRPKNFYRWKQRAELYCSHGWWEQKEDESQAHHTGMTPPAEISPGKLFSQDSDGAGAICH